MRRVISIYLPHWPIECLKRESRNAPSCPSAEAPETDIFRKPLALVEADAKGVRLTAVNHPAQELGLHIGMTLADARAIHPGLETAPATPEKDQDRLLAMAHWCGRYSPWVNVDDTHVSGTKGLWIDASGCAHLFGGEDNMLHDITARLQAFGFTAKAAMADTPGAAWALARYGSAETRRAAPKKNKQTLKPLYLGGLRLDQEILVLLRRLGLTRIGQLYDVPRAALTRRFKSQDISTAVMARLDQALGHRHEPISPLMPPPNYRSRLSFADPLQLLGGIKLSLEKLLETLCVSLNTDQKGARVLTLWAYRIDGKVSSVRIATSRPSRDPKHFQNLFQEKLDRIDAGFGIETLILNADVVEDLTPDQVDLQKDDVTSLSPKALAEWVDRIGNHDGTEKVFKTAPEESHIPERACRTAGTEEDHDWEKQPDKPVRPFRLLPRPEQIQVMAEIPEGPPLTFTWRKVPRRIAHAEGPERIAPEWWQDTNPIRSNIRDYYRVEDTEGRRYWLFRDGLYDDDTRQGPPQWFMHGIFA